jgi:lipopolysaccharide/colanic/teichoic acid biosynthesis glycosyltransferase
MLIIALIIRLDSPGPVIFRQVRIGQNRRKDRRQTDGDWQEDELERNKSERRREDILGRPFMLYKFRTMRHDGRELYPHLYDFDLDEEEVTNLHLAMPEDPRVTRIGHFLRRTSLDELPNFFNILKGDMALVGPRPELPDVAKYYKDWQKLKFEVKPGLTGKAQISGRGFLSFEETIIYDVEYVLERSFRTDLQLLWKTVFAVVKGIGAF